jgi:hypothetical protein
VSQVSIIRKRRRYLGTVEAPNERAAEAAAVAEFDLSDEQRRSARRFVGGTSGYEVVRLRDLLASQW